MKQLQSLSLFLALLLFGKTIFAQQDSMFVALSDDMAFVRHTIQPRQNLFRIAKHYSLPVLQLKEANQQTADSIKIGNDLIIPLLKNNFTYDTKQVLPPNVSLEPIYYYVSPGEKAFEVARKFHTPLLYIKKFNGLKKDDLNGIEILTVGYLKINSISLTPPLSIAKEKAASKSTTAAIDINPAKAPPIEKGNTDIDNQEKIDDPKPADKSVNTAQALLEKMYNAKSEKPELSEKGAAIWFFADSTQEVKKGYYALSNTISTGTVLKVTNPMNEEVRYVKVLGKIPEIAGNQRCIIKLSQEAAEELGAIDERFLVEIFYHQKN